MKSRASVTVLIRFYDDDIVLILGHLVLFCKYLQDYNILAHFKLKLYEKPSISDSFNTIL